MRNKKNILGNVLFQILLQAVKSLNGCLIHVVVSKYYFDVFMLF